MPTRSLVFALLFVTLSACKAEPESEPAAKPDLGPKAKAASDEVPAGLKDKLSFEARELADGNLLAVVPTGWKAGFMPGSFEPIDGEFGVSYAVSSNCDGTCTKKDWSAIVTTIEFGNSVPAGLTVETNEALGETGRLEVFIDGDATYVRAAWWLPDSRRYFYCRADLKGSMVGAKQAFISACKATHVADWD